MGLEEAFAAVVFLGIAFLIGDALFVWALNVGQLVGSMPCLRIALVRRKARIRVHRVEIRGTFPIVQLRITAPHFPGCRAASSRRRRRWSWPIFSMRPPSGWPSHGPRPGNPGRA